MPFEFVETEIRGVIKIRIGEFKDERGYFAEIWKRSEFKKHGIPVDFTQCNRSFSKRGVVRGLHLQREPHEQGKLVFVISGAIFDVAVDIRPTSPDFGKYVSTELSQGGYSMMWIPPGFAHGFMALEDSYVSYEVTKEYNREAESGIIWNDPDINIRWPKLKPLVSKKDSMLPTFRTYIDSLLRAER